MNCPRCQGSLSERWFSGQAGQADVKVELCDACSGVWIESRALPVLCPTLSHLPERRTEAALTGKEGGGISACPGCKATPHEVRVLDVAVDFCTGCGGVWLDADEYGESDAPNKTKKPAQTAYRAPPAATADAPSCAYCGDILEPDRSFMRERGHACPRCHYALQQRLNALRAEPTALEKFLQSVLSVALDVDITFE